MKKAVESGCNILATAHHEDDQAETMLMGLLGLSSGFGLTGMRPVYEKGNVRMLKPLLHCSREAIMTLCPRAQHHMV